MRITSSLWVSALMRREQANGSFCAVSKKGAEEAGAIFIVQIRNSDRAQCLFGPAPQALFDDEDAGARKFEKVLEWGSEEEVSSYLEKQMRFDSDIWVVEVETGRDELELSI